ncbi:sensor histidine kinase [Mumia sp. DW29H23]|uniref:sensor histidine kinase n=1 Tax=Mumia sp. DW29H23 TaxID=3421241 RepID=UPI003D69997E
MIRSDELRALPLFDGMPDAQLEELVALGDEVAIEPGEVLFREGEDADAWWLLVDGVIALSRRVGREETIVRRMEVPGQWAGGFRAWDAHGRYLATGRGERPGRLLRVPSEVLGDRSRVWFPFAAHLIEGVYSTARSIESTARHRESLLTLGTLAAGLAHEINNPAAAATRAVDALEETAAQVLASFVALAEHGVSPAALAATDGLRQELEPASDVDALARADAEDALADWLDERGVEDGWQLSAPLAAAGADVAWCERVAEAVGPAALGGALAWVASAAETAALLAEVKGATHRISSLVSAVRSYSQVDRGPTQEADLTEGIESSLIMLGHRLRDGVAVSRDYAPDLPRVEANVAELNQVWTNVIANAVDAMDGAGELAIAVRSDGEHIVVTFADSGPAVDDEVLARAFDAFYTTKDVGEGAGLGLDIARRVVEERHAGTIALTREGDRTVVRVTLPVHGRPG